MCLLPNVDDMLLQGVKKLGLSLELSYTNIRKYLICFLNSGVLSLLLHLSDVLDMSCCKDKFGALGLSVTAVQGELLSLSLSLCVCVCVCVCVSVNIINVLVVFVECVNLLGTFALKAQELLL